MTFADKLMAAVITGSSKNAAAFVTPVSPKAGRVTIHTSGPREQAKVVVTCTICGLDTHTDRNCAFKR